MTGVYPTEHWDAVVRSWRDSPGTSLLRAYSDAVNRRLLATWLPERSGRLLKTDVFDEAVGEGLVELLASRSDALTAVDASPATVGSARGRHPELEATVADVRSLPFASASFDAVVSNSTLDHFPSLVEVETALCELHRVLTPGGLLVLTLDNAWNPLVALRNRLPFPTLARAGLVPYYVGATCGPRRLRALLERVGFDVERIEAVMHVPRVLARSVGATLGRQNGVLLKPLLAAERLEHLPTRFLTGQFVAAKARRR